MIQHFYSVFEKSFDYYSNAGVVNYQTHRHICTECGNPYLDVVMPPFEYIIEGKRLGDIMSILPGYYLVSKKVYELFGSNNVSGVSFSTDITCVKWVDRKGREISQTVPEYFYMIIEGKCGDVCLPNGKALPPRCPGCHSLKINAMIRTAFNINKWDGSDIFTHSYATGMMCTEKVKKIIDNGNLKNFDFENCRFTSKSEN